MSLTIIKALDEGGGGDIEYFLPEHYRILKLYNAVLLNYRQDVLKLRGEPDRRRQRRKSPMRSRCTSPSGSLPFRTKYLRRASLVMAFRSLTRLLINSKGGRFEGDDVATDEEGDFLLQKEKWRSLCSLAPYL